MERYAITAHLRIHKARLARGLHVTITTRIIVAASWIAVGCLWHLSSAPAGLANPVNPAVVAGEATIAGVGTDLVTIQQASQHAVIHWSQFNLAPGEVTSFLQPVGGVALNRIFDASPSLINGALNATGTVFLLNPNGVLFGANAQVNVGGLVASTLHMTDADFLAGIYRFGGAATHLGLGETAPNAMVRNEGEITAGPFGAYLFAHNTENAGIIRSPDGQIVLAAGASAYLSNRPDGRGLFVEVTAPTGQAANLKDLVADGGQVSLFGKVVNQSGLIQANSVQMKSGRVELIATDAVTLADGSRILAKGDATGVSHGGTVLAKAGLQTGKTDFQKGALIDVSGGVQGGNGGFIDLSASKVTWGGAFRAHALAGYRGGKLLIDPIFDGNSPITASTLRSLTDQVINSGLNDIEFQSTGDLNVTARFDLSEWVLPAGQTGTLTFNAGQNLLFNNASITNGERMLGVAGSRWDYRLFADQHIEIKGSVLSTGAGGTITMEAGRSLTAFGDIRLLQSGATSTGQPIVETVDGGDITITTDRDLIAPSGFLNGQVTGIRLNESGNLALNMGRDFLGGPVGNTKIGPGFLLGNGNATIKAGLNVGTGPTQHPTGGNIGSTDAYTNITVGGGRIDENDPNLSLTEVYKIQISAEAPGHIYWGLVQDRGLVEDLFQSGNFYVTSHPASSVSLLASVGDIFLKPQLANSAGGINAARKIYPASLDAQAPNGSIKIESDLTFFPSVTGRLNFSAKNDISGVTRNIGFRKDPRYKVVYVGHTFPEGSWQLLDLQTAVNDPFLSQFINRVPPAAAQNSKPPDSSFSAQVWPEIPTFAGAPVVKILQGDVTNLQGLYSDSQFVAKQRVLPQNVDPSHQVQDVKFKAESGDIHTLQIEALSPGFKKKVTVEAGRDIGANLDANSNQLTGGDFTLIASVPESVTATVAAGRNLGFRRFGATQTGLEFFGRGAAKIRVGTLDSEGNLVPNTGNLDLGDGRGIQHRSPNFGETNAPGLIDIGVGNDLTMTQTRIISHNGASIWIHGLGTKPALNPGGGPTDQLVQGTIDPATKVLMVDGKPVKVEGVPLVLDGAQPVISQGTVLDRPGEQINGKTFLPVFAKGKPILVDGRIVLLVDGQIQLVDASLVSIEQASGGKLTVGTFGSDPNSGIMTIRGGNIDIKTKGDVDVFKSRIATLTGGNISVYSVEGDINAGTGGRNESIAFTIQQGKDANGSDLPDLVFIVPGSGIFTHHGNDPKFPLNFPKFDTPEITALKNEIVMQNFLGRDTTSLETQVSKLVAAREPEYRQIFEQFITQNPDKPEIINGVPTGRFLPLELGDINLRAGRDLVVPSAGIRGRRIRITAGRNLDLQGGNVEGEVQFDVAGSVKGNLSSFVGSFSGTSAVGGSVSGGASAGGSSLGGGLSGVTGTVAATASSTASSSGTAARTVEAVQERVAEAAAQSPSGVAKNQTAARGQDGQTKMVQTVKMKRGVVIQVDVKPEVKPAG
ncbi:MAG: filamentous hemagglutinin N-terminal domain-containing protein [Nitrospirae bacterium]|nr:filamentous hemagglutinin N-terminal domain-containing protein [Nitrospirota bacterium]